MTLHHKIRNYFSSVTPFYHATGLQCNVNENNDNNERAAICRLYLKKAFLGKLPKERETKARTLQES